MSWALLLSGGAFKGAFQVPVIEGLVMNYGWPDWIGGVSIGAANAALLATKELERIREVWDQIDSIKDAMTPQVDLWNGRWSLKRYRRLLGHAGVDTPQIPCHVGAVDLRTSRYQSIDLGPLSFEDRLDAVMVSSSQPFPIHERHQFRGRPMVDGGVRSQVPRIPRGRKSFDCIRVVSLFPLQARLETEPMDAIDGPFEQGLRSLEILSENVQRSDVQRIKGWARDQRVEWYGPPTRGAIGAPFDHSPQVREQRYQLGEWALANPEVL